jgi:Glycosyl transferase 4-like domain/Glycosyl transferases group 1
VRLLFLSFYYRPDLSAGSFRATALVQAVRERAPPGTQIEVVTTLPNRYHSFAPDAPEHELSAGLEIRRILLPPHRSDVLGQSRAFGRYARAVLRHVAGRRYDIVCATSSRLMTAALGAWIARRQQARLYLDIRDIFVDTIGDLLPPPLSVAARGVFSRLESWTVRHADRINLVSPGFAEYFRSRYGERPYAWFTNGIDDEFLSVAPAAAPPAVGGDGRTAVVYAGNIGAGQALHEILPGLARALHARARFVVIGDGGRRRMLEEALRAAAVDNVELLPPMERGRLLEAYRAADVLLLHLGAAAAFEKVLPSKLFEYAALGKPLWAGVGGYAAHFIAEEIDNAAVFTPGDVAAAVRAFDSLSLGEHPRPAFIERYRRRHIAARMADDLLALLPQHNAASPP